MNDLVRSTLPRRVWEERSSGWVDVAVRPPSAREAFALFALLPGYLQGDEDDAWQLRQLLMGWLPLRLASTLTARLAEPASVARDVLELVNRGLPASPETEDKKPKLTFEALARAPWDLMAADVAHVWNLSVEDVFTLPFPKFVLLQIRLSAADARYTLRRMTLHLLPHLSDAEETIEDLRGRAGLDEGDVRTEAEKAEAEELDVRMSRALLKINFSKTREEVQEATRLYWQLVAEKKRREGSAG